MLTLIYIYFRKERFQIKNGLKAGELRLMLMLQDLQILKGFEEEEPSPSTKLEKPQQQQKITSMIPIHYSNRNVDF